MPDCSRLRASLSARRASRRLSRSVSWLSVRIRRSTGNASSSRPSTLISIELSTRIRDTSASGTPSLSLSKVWSVHTTEPSGGLRSCALLLRLACFSSRHRGVLGVRLGLRLRVLDRVLRRLDDDVARVSKPARPARPAIWWNSRIRSTRLRCAVVLRQPGEEHGPDRHVDADAQGVGAADDGEQPCLGELLDEPPVARQQPGVVHADPLAQQLGQRLAEAGAEPEARPAAP